MTTRNDKWTPRLRTVLELRVSTWLAGSMFAQFANSRNYAALHSQLWRVNSQPVEQPSVVQHSSTEKSVSVVGGTLPMLHQAGNGCNNTTQFQIEGVLVVPPETVVLVSATSPNHRRYKLVSACNQSHEVEITPGASTSTGSCAMR